MMSMPVMGNQDRWEADDERLVNLLIQINVAHW